MNLQQVSRAAVILPAPPTSQEGRACSQPDRDGARRAYIFRKNEKARRGIPTKVAGPE